MNGKFQGYTASNTLSWFHLTTSSTSTTMSYTVDANTQTNMREGYITLTQKDSQKQLKIHVTQEAKEIETSYNFYFTDNHQKAKIVEASESGETLSIGITSETVPSMVLVPFTWRTESATVPGFSIQGTDEGVTIQVPRNNTGSLRNIVVIFTQGTTEDTIRLTIQQNSSATSTSEYKFIFKNQEYQGKVPKLTFNKEGGSQTIEVISCMVITSTSGITYTPVEPYFPEYGNGINVSAQLISMLSPGYNIPTYTVTVTVGSSDLNPAAKRQITFRQNGSNETLDVELYQPEYYES